MDYSTILQRIRPGPQEKAKLKSIIKEFLKKIKYKTILGGSGAKETWLANSHDIDIFVIFPKNVNDISDKLEVELKKSFKKVDRLHGSRDYFQVKYKGILFELVPIVEISKAEQALNITDISPLHSKWVNKHTKGKKDEILLLKQFCRAQGLYGAESHIAGFSGYIIEILVAHYSSFEKVLKSVIKWKNQEVIDISKYYPKNDVLFNLNTSKTQCPLIIVDPVDKTRNAAAAVSVEKYKLFQKLAKRFLKKPKEDFFLEKEFNIELLGKEAKRKKKALLVINLVPLSGKTDVVGMKLVKGRDFLLNKLEPFEVKKFGWDWKKEVTYYFFLKKKKIAAVEERKGPPLPMKEHVKRFKKFHKNNYIKNGHVWGKVKVKHTEAEEYVKFLVKEKYFKEKVKKIKKVFLF